MSKALKEIMVGQAGIGYVRDRLAHGNTLAKLMLLDLRLEAGSAMTMLPDCVAPQTQDDFYVGGKLPTPHVSEWKGLESGGEPLLMIPVPHTDDWLASKVRNYLVQGHDRICIIEDALRRPNDKNLRKLLTNHARFNEEVYHLLFHEDAGTDRVSETIRTAKSLPTFVGAFSVWKDDPVALRHGILALTQLQTLAVNANGLFVGAFDGEGYLIWTEKTSSE